MANITSVFHTSGLWFILIIALLLCIDIIVTPSCLSIFHKAYANHPFDDDYVKLSNLPIGDIAGQMTQLDIGIFMDTSSNIEYKLNKTKLIEFVDGRRVGGLMNIPPTPKNARTSIPTVDDWRRIMNDIFEISSRFGSRIPIIYGIDSVHGANYVFNATIFPHQIGIGATFSRDIAFRVGQVTATETRYAGIPWVFSPTLGIATQPVWAGVYETFGEDPVVVRTLGKSIIDGLQGPPPEEMDESNWRHTVAACGKHFVGNSDVRTGRYRTPAYIPMNLLYEKYIPPFLDVSSDGDDGVLSIMGSYVELNGRPVVSSDLLLNFVLRKYIGFKGTLVTEYNDVYNLATFHRSTKNFTTAVLDSINFTSIDIATIGIGYEFPFFNEVIRNYNNNGGIESKRLRESGYRVMYLKRAVSLVSPDENNNTAYINPVPKKVKGCVFACPSHRDAAFRAAIESITLLKNDGDVLPLKIKPFSKVAVVGQGCDSVPLMSGGRTIKLEGSSDKADFPYGSTIYDEMKAHYPLATVKYAEGCNVTEGSVCGEYHVQRAVNISMWSDVVLLCVGESHYADHFGDIDNMVLPGGQIDMARRVIKAQPNNKVIVLLIEGRPRILQDIPRLVPAVVHLYLPGPAGGLAAVSVLLGKYNPSGRLPITYPSSLSNAPINYDRKWSGNAFNDYQLEWEFGHGLSYVAIEVNSISVKMGIVEYLVTVSLSNKGNIYMDTYYTVMVYASQKYDNTPPSVKRLVAFKKVFLRAGVVSLIVELGVPINSFNYFNEYLCQSTDDILVTLTCEGKSTEIIPSSNRDVSCSAWGIQVLKNTQFTVNVPTPTPLSVIWKSSASAYFISSVVCFGAGIVGTVIFITWLRKKGETENGLLLEPTSV